MFNNADLEVIKGMVKERFTDVSISAEHNMKLMLLTSSDVAKITERRWESWKCYTIDNTKVFCDKTQVALNVVVQLLSNSKLTRSELLRFLKTEYNYTPPIFDMSNFSYHLYKTFYMQNHVMRDDIAAAIYVVANNVLKNSHVLVRCLELLPNNLGEDLVIVHRATKEIHRVKHHCVTTINDKVFDPVYGYYDFNWEEYLSLLNKWNIHNFKIFTGNRMLDSMDRFLKV